MIGLAFDTTTDTFYAALIDLTTKTITAEQAVNAKSKQADIAPLTIKALLASANLTWLDIACLYVVLGPGKYTGLKVGAIIAKMIKLAVPEINIYRLSSLYLQTGNQAGVSIITARHNASYLAIFEPDHQVILPPQLVDNQTLAEIIAQFAKLPVYKDYKNQTWSKHLLAVIDHAELLTDVAAIKPFYLRGITD